MASNSTYTYVPQDAAPIHTNADEEHYELEPYAPQPQLHDPYAQNESFDHNALAPQYRYGGLESARDLARTPSPTPSETEALGEKKMFNWRKTFSPKRENWVRLAIIAAIMAILITVTVLQSRILKALQPAAIWAKKTPGGFMIAVAALFILSFPPLFGAGIVALLCGAIWGPAYGFAIVVAGQFTGELANYFLFKYLCRARSEKTKKSSIKYAAFGRAVEDGGLLVAIAARYSILPPHIVTAVFATCGMKLWVFVVSAIVSLPQNFVNVYIGSFAEAEAKGESTTSAKIVDYVTLGVTVIVTIVVQRYIDVQVNKAKPEIIHERQKAR
ncbi:hypothetical protein FIBSPDRAFT_911532 [Athelia psychrophila]|uniref:Golgi apparatus membrane protein TVP38 n=1 Tax=Athelia psychrophila TaxID=1759441 RepID=A0A166HJ81_9AGAM|nr:hypothetical protein FIBSPDRAFT_911532 [Fibularhizoctonia sp. CBS 109695]